MKSTPASGMITDAGVLLDQPKDQPPGQASWSPRTISSMLSIYQSLRIGDPSCERILIIIIDSSAIIDICVVLLKTALERTELQQRQVSYIDSAVKVDITLLSAPGSIDASLSSITG